MSAYRCIIVDDEQLARESLKRLVARSAHLDLVGEADDGESAVGLANQVRPDLVFLDIRMPGLSGLEVATRLPAESNIIFTTAYDEFAVTAFELQALDYLLKPFGPRRFQQAVERLVDRDVDPDRKARVRSALSDAPLSRLFVRERGRLISVPVASITHIMAADDYAELVTGEGTHLMSVRMQDLENRLDGTRFVRIHRSVIVNLDYMVETAPCGNGRWEVTLRDGTTLSSSRSGAARLRETLSAGR